MTAEELAQRLQTAADFNLTMDYLLIYSALAILIALLALLVCIVVEQVQRDRRDRKNYPRWWDA